MKKFILFIIISTLILFSISCSKTENTSNKTKVVFWHVMGGPTGDALKALIDSFNTLNPDIEIIPISVGNYNALSQKIMASINNPPVISQMYESWTSELYEAERLTPIEDLMDSTYLNEIKNDMFEIFVKDNTFNGKIVTLPFNKSVPAYFYNVELYKEKGIEKFPETWDEFYNVMKTLTYDKNNDGEMDVYGTAFNINTWMFESRLFQFGGQLTDENLKPMFNSEAGIKAINIDLTLLKNKTAYITTGYQHQDDFLAQKVSTIFGSCVSLSFILASQPQFTLGIAPVPAGDKKAVLISGTNIGVFSKASDKQKQAAFKFIKWFTSPEIQAIWAYKTGYLPVKKSSLENELLKEQFNKFPGLQSVYEQLNYAYMEPQANVWYLGRQILGKALEYIVKGSETPKEALDKAAKEYEKELKNN